MRIIFVFYPKAEVLLTVCEALMEFVTVHGADRDVRTAEQLIGRNSMIDRVFTEVRTAVEALGDVVFS